jgi:hypothetical protein
MDKLQIAARIIVTIDNPSGAWRGRGRAAALGASAAAARARARAADTTAFLFACVCGVVLPPLSWRVGAAAFVRRLFHRSAVPANHASLFFFFFFYLFPRTADVIAISARPYAQRAVLKFANYTGAQVRCTAQCRFRGSAIRRAAARRHTAPLSRPLSLSRARRRPLPGATRRAPLPTRSRSSTASRAC